MFGGLVLFSTLSSDETETEENQTTEERFEEEISNDEDNVSKIVVDDLQEDVSQEETGENEPEIENIIPSEVAVPTSIPQPTATPIPPTSILTPTTIPNPTYSSSAVPLSFTYLSSMGTANGSNPAGAPDFEIVDFSSDSLNIEYNPLGSGFGGINLEETYTLTAANSATIDVRALSSISDPNNYFITATGSTGSSGIAIRDNFQKSQLSNRKSILSFIVSTLNF